MRARIMQLKRRATMKFLSIVCFLCGLGLFVLAWRGGFDFTTFGYTVVLLPRYLALTAIALIIAGCVSAFAPHP